MIHFFSFAVSKRVHVLLLNVKEVWTDNFKFGDERVTDNRVLMHFGKLRAKSVNIGKIPDVFRKTPDACR